MTGFEGFPKEAFEFLRGLARNNDKKWFDAHREQYDEMLMAPAREFVIAMDYDPYSDANAKIECLKMELERLEIRLAALEKRR